MNLYGTIIAYGLVGGFGGLYVALRVYLFIRIAIEESRKER